MDVELHGAEDLAKVARALKAAGDRDLRKELLRGFRMGAKPTIKDVRASALSTLPHRGGLATYVAKASIGVRTRLSGSKGNEVGVQIKAKKGRGLAAMNAGKFRHPVFGRKEFVTQKVTPGWFSKPIEKNADQIRSSLERVMAEVANKIERSV